MTETAAAKAENEIAATLEQIGLLEQVLWKRSRERSKEHLLALGPKLQTEKHAMVAMERLRELRRMLTSKEPPSQPIQELGFRRFRDELATIHSDSEQLFVCIWELGEALRRDLLWVGSDEYLYVALQYELKPDESEDVRWEDHFDKIELADLIAFFKGQAPSGGRRSFLLRSAEAIKNSQSLFKKLKDGFDPVSQLLRNRISSESMQRLNEVSSPDEHCSLLVEVLNDVILGESIYAAERFSAIALSKEVSDLLARNPRGEELIRLNRLLLENVYPADIEKSGTAFDRSRREIALHYLTFLYEARSQRERIRRTRLGVKGRYLRIISQIMLVVLLTFLAFIVFRILSGPDMGQAGGPLVLQLEVLVVAFAGALGAIMMHLRRLRDEVTRIRELFSSSYTMLAQPLIGAASALVFWLVLKSGLITVAKNIADIGWQVNALFGFLAGFSEPFFINTLSRFTESPGQEKEKKKPSPGRE